MSWNHRILAIESEDDVYFQVYEVFYDDKGKPRNYTQNEVAVGGESIESIRVTLAYMEEATRKPVLYYGKRFPEEYKC